jgi:hypothetical protein
MDFMMILNWIYPLVDLIVMVCCFVYIRHVIGTMLGIAFGLDLIISLLWRGASFMNYAFDINTSSVYQILGFVNPALFIVSSILMIIAIIKIGELLKTGHKFSTQQSPGSVGDTDRPRLDSLQTDMVKPAGNILIYLVPFLFGVAALLIGIVMLFDRHNEDEVMILFLIGSGFVLFSTIYFLVVLYRLWDFTIQASKRLGLRPDIDSPGKAVGFLFIPLFSYYWIFVACGKLPVNLNAIAEKKGYARGASEIMGIIIAVLSLVSIIPFLGYVTGAVTAFILVPVFLQQNIKVVNALQSLEQNVDFEQTRMIDIEAPQV